MQMRKKITFWAVLICLSVAFFVPPAAADWSFRFGDNGYWPATNTTYNFTRVDFFITTPNSSVWTPQGVNNFSASGWSSTVVNPTYATASGPPATGAVFWTLNFTGSPPATFNFDYLVYTGNTVVSAYSMVLNNGTWNSNQNTGSGGGWSTIVVPDMQTIPSNYDTTPIPLPGTILLLGTGLLGVILFRRKTQIA